MADLTSADGGLRELALFAGAGGGILGGKLLGWRTVCAVEWQPYAIAVLCQRQNDGILSPFPVWDDVRTFDGRPWRGIVDVVSGGFPCQDISAAGKRAGIEGERSGMWKHMARVVCEVRPEWVFVENSPMLVSRGLGTVLRDLAEIGFDAAWTVLSAAELGAPHLRERIWIVAHAAGGRLERWPDGEPGLAAQLVAPKWIRESPLDAAQRILGMDDGVAGRMGGLKAAGNGQVPQCAAEAWRRLGRRMMNTPNAKLDECAIRDAAPATEKE